MGLAPLEEESPHVYTALHQELDKFQVIVVGFAIYLVTHESVTSLFHPALYKEKWLRFLSYVHMDLKDKYPRAVHVFANTSSKEFDALCIHFASTMDALLTHHFIECGPENERRIRWDGNEQSTSYIDLELAGAMFEVLMKHENLLGARTDLADIG